VPLFIKEAIVDSIGETVEIVRIDVKTGVPAYFG
jgi:hypothetical protein